MTNEEAIKVLTEQLAYSDDVLPARLKEAYEVAIDKFKAIKEGVVFYSNRPIEDIVLEARTDAIEEFKDRLLELCDCGIERADCTGGNCYKCLDNKVDYSSIVDLAEELKGKNMAESKIVLQMTEEWKRNMKIAYNQALDDFLKALEKNQQDNWIDNLEYGITFADVEKVINQLKL